MRAWLTLLVFAYVQVNVCSGWSYPESTGNGWTDVCSSGNRQSPINLDSSIPATVHSPIYYQHYFSKKKGFYSKKPNNGFFLKYKLLNGRLYDDGNTVRWTIGNNLAKPFKKCMKSKHRRCPRIFNGPFGGSNTSHAYWLWELHFHWGSAGDNSLGSEHNIDYHAYPMEMHMVHVEDEYVNDDGSIDEAGAKADKYGYAIISIMFEVNDTLTKNQKPLEKLTDKIDNLGGGAKRRKRRSPVNKYDDPDSHLIELENLKVGIQKLKMMKRLSKRNADLQLRPASDPVLIQSIFNPGRFIKQAAKVKKGNEFSKIFTYHGSFSEPGCEQAVTWVVFESPLEIKQDQLELFKSLYEDNYRKISCDSALSCTTICTACITHGMSGNNDQQHLIHDEIPKGDRGRNRWESKPQVG